MTVVHIDMEPEMTVLHSDNMELKMIIIQVEKKKKD